jgi:hypothetical protein
VPNIIPPICSSTTADIRPFALFAEGFAGVIEMPETSGWMKEEQARLREITSLGCIACRLHGLGFQAIQVYYISWRPEGIMGAFGLCGSHHAQYTGSTPGECEILTGSEEELIALAETLLELKRAIPSSHLPESETSGPEEV